MKLDYWICLVAVWVGLSMTAVWLWLFSTNDSLVVWIGRIVLPFLSIDVAWILYRRRPTPERRVEDPLRDAVGGYYERDGMCFCAQFKLIRGICWVHLYVQNRYARGGSLRITMTRDGADGETVDVGEEIDCDGGTLLVRRFPLRCRDNWLLARFIIDWLLQRIFRSVVAG